jgi:hypothetical protein
MRLLYLFFLKQKMKTSVRLHGLITLMGVLYFVRLSILYYPPISSAHP